LSEICSMKIAKDPLLSPISDYTCPHCANVISGEELLKHGVQQQLEQRVQSQLLSEKKKLKAQMEALTAQEREMKKQLANLVDQRMSEEKKKMREEVGKEYQNVIETNRAELRQKSIELRRMRELEDDAERLKREHKDALHLAKLNAKKAARQDMDSQVFEAKKTLKSEHELEVMDLKQRLQNQNAAIDELKRKKEQGSMQAQGEVQEVLIEQKLRDLFPADRIEEVKKGANGADCIQHVQDGMILNAVKIYYESKRTKAFSPAWITKFKEDIHRLGADAGVLVTSVMPKGITKPSLVDGVWVCQLQDLPLLSQLLRKHVLLYSSARLAQESKGTKMELLYDYLTSELFANNIMRVLDRFDQLRSQLDKERRSLEKSWSKREKLITQAYKSLLDVNTSIQTIGGSDMDLLDRGFDALEKGEE